MHIAHRIQTPLSREVVASLSAGDHVLISGTIFTARDAAHKQLVEALSRGESLPFDISGQIIYYVGPCPARPGQVIGSAGPTTSLRMDPYTPVLIEKGLKGMIGKGYRSRQVIDAMMRYGAVYLVALGGAGALLASRIKKAEVIAYPDLGPEAIRQLEVEDFPAVVAIDASGRNVYEEAPLRYRMILK